VVLVGTKFKAAGRQAAKILSAVLPSSTGKNLRGFETNKICILGMHSTIQYLHILEDEGHP
jgi:hypothetical protein